MAAREDAGSGTRTTTTTTKRNQKNWGGRGMMGGQEELGGPAPTAFETAASTGEAIGRTGKKEIKMQTAGPSSSPWVRAATLNGPRIGVPLP